LINSEPKDTLQAIVRALLAAETNPTPERIRELINNYRAIHTISDQDAEALARHFETMHQVHMDVGSCLTDGLFEPWLDGRRALIDPYYWSRYKDLLVGKNFNNQVLSALDDVTDRVLGLLENPEKPGPWDRRGMVVGHVQSGKTANYTGLVCKAADAGYKLIIVIAGIHNNLRNQTQQRIDEGFVGRDSAEVSKKSGGGYVGVGRFDNRRRPVTFTTSTKDFNQAIAESVGVSIRNLNEPAVLVIKKNSSTLKNLLKWLQEHNAAPGTKTIDVPMLLIDDEADNASINIRWGKDEVARINGQIRQLLNTFERSCYVGYTATPFANIFIDPDTDDAMFKGDLFPENFIVSLDPPTNYFGPTKVFLEESDEFIRLIDDTEGDDTNAGLLPRGHTIDFSASELPESMKKAIRCFVLVRATRLARGDSGTHNSMLINASRFTGVQNRLRNEVHGYLDTLKDAARIRGALPFEETKGDFAIDSLHATWLEEYSLLGDSWDVVYSELHEALAPIKVVAVNSGSAGSLSYSDHERSGLNVIAVGGYSLSRGLTLEGLSISYFHRNSLMYDTLLQMGRWFGYRVGYEDLCRIWMTEEAEGWYAHIAEAVEELRTDLRKMEQVGATPRQFGLKVRSHPEMLLVTARNRMGAGQRIPVRIGLSNKFVETTTLRNTAAALDRNREAAKRLAAELNDLGLSPKVAEKVRGGFLHRSAPAALVIEFLEGFVNDPASLLTEPSQIVQYISERVGAELELWDILVVGVESAPAGRSRSVLMGREIICQQRTAGTKYPDDQRSIHMNKQRVASRGVEQAGLTSVQISAAKSEFEKEPEALARIQKGETPNYPDRIFRRVRDRPLLIIHSLELTSPTEASVIASDVVAWGISFPVTTVEEERVEYMVNAVWLQEVMRASDDLDDEVDDVE
jgi:hypothetical protein